MNSFKYKKKFGQNFLQNEYVIEKIVNSINPSENDMIIEIGPGAGAITSRLKKYHANLLCYEIDTDTSKYLEKLLDEKTKIIYNDFLSSDIKSELNKYKYKDLYIIGNLPYYITTPIIEKIIDLNLNQKEVLIMVQKEVAERFTAKPKTRAYGYFTVLLNYWFDIKKVVDVNKNNFYPIPNVDSTVIKLVSNKKAEIDYEKFIRLVKDSFKFKRKQIKNNLQTYNLDLVDEILKSKGLSINNRAEDIDLDTFLLITKNI